MSAETPALDTVLGQIRHAVGDTALQLDARRHLQCRERALLPHLRADLAQLHALIGRALALMDAEPPPEPPPRTMATRPKARAHDAKNPRPEDKR